MNAPQKSGEALRKSPITSKSSLLLVPVSLPSQYGETHEKRDIAIGVIIMNLFLGVIIF